MTRGCSVDDCARPHYARGWCRLHWQRWYLGLRFEDRKPAPVTRRSRPSYFRGGKGV